jgi:hypothetical protein
MKEVLFMALYVGIAFYLHIGDYAKILKLVDMVKLEIFQYLTIYLSLNFLLLCTSLFDDGGKSSQSQILKKPTYILGAVLNLQSVGILLYTRIYPQLSRRTI